MLPSLHARLELGVMDRSYRCAHEGIAQNGSDNDANDDEMDDGSEGR